MDESMLVGTGHWRGSISPACPEEFFSSYQELIGGLAKQAQALKVDLLIIGSEFNSLEFWTYEDSGGENRSYWSDVIAYMRSVAPSVRLGYSQNWDMLPNAPAWFSELDVLALDAYFPAYGAKSDSSTEAVYAGLAQNRELISDWRAKFPELPLYITEVGISSIGGLYETPYVWGELVNAPVDLESQAIFTAAACQFYSENADGIFWWFTTITMLPDPHNDRGFDYIGKPAEAVIADCNLQFRESS